MDNTRKEALEHLFNKELRQLVGETIYTAGLPGCIAVTTAREGSPLIKFYKDGVTITGAAKEFPYKLLVKIIVSVDIMRDDYEEQWQQLRGDAI